MELFGWITDGLDLPPAWDLRDCGWTLCLQGEHRSACTHPMLGDARALSAEGRLALVRGSGSAAQLILVGVEESAERAALLALGCAEALPATITLTELEARAQRVAQLAAMLPRSRPAGPLTLDLIHRDARLGPNWLALHPREFGLLWRLADHPGERVTRRDLLRDVWRIQHEPETNSVEVHVSRLRSKLAGVGCEALVETASEGGYRLVAAPPLPRVAPHGARSTFAPASLLADS